MKAALVEMLTVYSLLLLLFQPILHDIYSTRANAVEMVLDSAIQKAAASEEGMFTADIVQEMTGTLTSTFLIDPGGIAFSGTMSPTPRGQYIEGRLTVVSTPRWLFRRMFGAEDNDPGVIVRYAKQMSEAIVR